MASPLHTFRFRRDHAWTPEHLSEYLDEEMPERGRARVRRHVADCPECRQALQTLGRLLGRLRTETSRGPAQDPEAASTLAAAVRRRLEETPGTPSSSG